MKEAKLLFLIFIVFSVGCKALYGIKEQKELSNERIRTFYSSLPASEYKKLF
jgi:hypothetical protein